MQLGSIVELNCNLHPLDGTASSARSALKKIDVEHELKSGEFGSDCELANFVYAVTKMRYNRVGVIRQGLRQSWTRNTFPGSYSAGMLKTNSNALFHLIAVFHVYSGQFTKYLTLSPPMTEISVISNTTVDRQ